jgi:hypothetical protein
VVKDKATAQRIEPAVMPLFVLVVIFTIKNDRSKMEHAFSLVNELFTFVFQEPTEEIVSHKIRVDGRYSPAPAQ